MRTAPVTSPVRDAVATVIENAFEQARPVHARRCVCVLVGLFTWFLRPTRHDRGTQPGIGRQHAVEAYQMQVRTRHQGG